MTTSTNHAGRRDRRPMIAYPIIIALIVGVGIFFLMRSSFSSSGGQYAVGISDIAQAPAKYAGRFVRVVGDIKHGSTLQTTVGGNAETRFAIIDASGHELDVVYPRSPADAYEEGREAIVEGRFGDDGVLAASKLTVKCPSKYQTEDDAGEGEGYFRKKVAPPAGGGAS